MSSIVLARPTPGPATGNTSTSPSPSGIPGLDTEIINGQLVLVLTDPTRNDKLLSVAENTFVYSKVSLNDNEWIRVSNATAQSNGIVCKFDGCVCFASAQCASNDDGTSKDIHLYVNNVDRGVIGTLSGTNNTFVNTIIDFNYEQGDIIRLQAVNTSSSAAGVIRDVAVTITTKHRA